MSALLDPDPERRPWADGILQAIQPSGRVSPRPVRVEVPAVEEHPFVGRARELAVLRQAFDVLRDGRQRTVLVHGPPSGSSTAMARCPWGRAGRGSVLGPRWHSPAGVPEAATVVVSTRPRRPCRSSTRHTDGGRARSHAPQRAATPRASRSVAHRSAARARGLPWLSRQRLRGRRGAVPHGATRASRWAPSESRKANHTTGVQARRKPCPWPWVGKGWSNHAATRMCLRWARRAGRSSTRAWVAVIFLLLPRA